LVLFPWGWGRWPPQGCGVTRHFRFLLLVVIAVVVFRFLLLVVRLDSTKIDREGGLAPGLPSCGHALLNPSSLPCGGGVFLFVRLSVASHFFFVCCCCCCCCALFFLVYRTRCQTIVLGTPLLMLQIGGQAEKERQQQYRRSCVQYRLKRRVQR